MHPLRCILHVGTTKTGSSSIQESLYFHLRSRDFQYCSLGDVNGDHSMATIFRTHPEDFHYNKKLGLSTCEVQKIREIQIQRLTTQVEKSSRYATIRPSSADGIGIG